MSLKSALSAAKKKYGITTPAAPSKVAGGGAAEAASPGNAVPVLEKTSNPATSTQIPSQVQKEETATTPAVATSSAPVVVEVQSPQVGSVAPPANANPQSTPPLEVKTTSTKVPEIPSAAGVLLRPKRSREEGNGNGEEGPTKPKFGKDEVMAFMAKVKATQPKI